jgi:hypothetical protein
VAIIWWLQKLRHRQSVSKRAAHNFHVEIFNLKKLNDVDAKERYHIKISNRFAALQKLDDKDVDISKLEKVLDII